MDGLRMALAVLLAFSCSYNFNSASMLEVTLRQGDNTTLYCDRNVSTGVYIVWFIKNCPHENQAPLILKVKDHFSSVSIRKFPRFKFIRNFSSDSYNMLIINATSSDEGLYYCGTEEVKVHAIRNKTITSEEVYKYSDITTKITVHSCDLSPNIYQTLDSGVSCNLLFSLFTTISLLLILVSLFLVYLLCQKSAKATQDDEKRPTTQTQGKNMFYAALEMHPASQTPQRKRMIQNSDSRMYSTVRYISHVGNFNSLKRK